MNSNVTTRDDGGRLGDDSLGFLDDMLGSSAILAPAPMKKVSDDVNQILDIIVSSDEKKEEKQSVPNRYEMKSRTISPARDQARTPTQIQNQTPHEKYAKTKDTDAPISFFGFSKSGIEDDTISQITTSITSQSLYDSHNASYSHESPSKGGSYHWLSGKTGTNRFMSLSHNQPQQQQDQQQRLQQQLLSQGGETSYADTLDEIANMLHDSGPSPLNSQPQQTSDGALDFFRSVASDEILKSSSMKADGVLFHKKSTEQVVPKSRSIKSKEAPPLSANEVYRNHMNSTWTKKKRQPRSTHRPSAMEPFLAHIRLQFRYWISLAVPKEWRQKGDSKNSEDHPEPDYFSKASIKAGVGGSTLRKISRSKRRQHVVASFMSVAVCFFALTMVLLVARLAYMHSQNRIYSSYARSRPQNSHSDADLFDSNGYGDESGSRKYVKGGMAARGVRGRKRHSQHGEAYQMLSPQEQKFHHRHHVGIPLPPAFDNLADISDTQTNRDVPFFWHIPRTGGGTINDIFGGCFHLTLASDAGGAGDAGQELTLRVMKVSKHFSYVNVDTSTPAGIERAKILGLAESGMADMVVSTMLAQASALFTKSNKGRMFTMFRHPVERAASLFHYVQDTQWRRRQTYQKELSDLTIEEYFKSGLAENNWMTRFLTNEITKAELSMDDLLLAKEILRRKCLVGLLSEKGESFARFEKYFEFPLRDDNQKECHEKKLQWAWSLKHRHDEVEEGTALWDLISSQNTMDMELYDYAQTLFQEQGQLFS